jgi:hypothetical protein
MGCGALLAKRTDVLGIRAMREAGATLDGFRKG